MRRLQPDTHVVIAGLANSYSHYITTYEEYQVRQPQTMIEHLPGVSLALTVVRCLQGQRYEAASTLYGPK